MKPPLYYVKRRSLDPAQRNPFRPRQVWKRGPWRTIASAPTFAEARAEMQQRSKRGGLYEWSIFYKGKPIP